jgi:anti-anti-sigma factor
MEAPPISAQLRRILGTHVNFQTRTTGDALEILISGRLTYEDHEQFREMITSIDGSPGQRIVFDFSDLAFIDSAGLGMLVVAKDLAAAKAMTVQMRNAKDLVGKLMTLVKFHDVIPVAD